jgi:prefoldin subunit 5
MALLIGLSTSALGQRSDQVYNSLAKSRDALLDQRTYLQAEADKLQRQLDTVNSYLRDNDRALRDVETAMKRN